MEKKVTQKFSDPQVVGEEEFEYESYYIQDEDNISDKQASDHSSIQNVINSLSKVSRGDLNSVVNKQNVRKSDEFSLEDKQET